MQQLLDDQPIVVTKTDDVVGCEWCDGKEKATHINACKLCGAFRPVGPECMAKFIHYTVRWSRYVGCDICETMGPSESWDAIFEFLPI
jgi:hypothetical protein